MTKMLSRFIILAHSLDNRFAELSSLVMETEYLFKQESKEIDKRFSQLPESDQELRVEDFAEETVRFQDDYPNQFRKAMVVTWYTYLETALEDITSVLKWVSGSLEDPSTDKQIPWAKRLVKYIGDLAEVDLIGDSLWQSIDNARRVRNNIVHADARLKSLDDDKRLYSYLCTNSKYFSLNGKRFTINSEYLQHLCQIAKTFLNIIIKELMEYERALVQNNGEGKPV